MLSRVVSRVKPSQYFKLVASFSDEVASDGKMHLNFSLPHESLVNERIQSVTIPGLEGEYAVNAGHSAIISEMRPGVVKVYKEEVFMFLV